MTANSAYRDLSHVKSRLIAARGGAFPCPTSLHSNSLASNSGAFSDAHNVDPASEEGTAGEAVVPLRAVKGKSTRNSVRHFVDWKAVAVYGGDGGDGSLSLCSLYANEFAGNCLNNYRNQMN